MKPKNQEPRKERRKVVVDSNHPFLYPIIIDTKHQGRGGEARSPPRNGRVPIPSRPRNNYSQRGLTSLSPDLLVTNPKYLELAGSRFAPAESLFPSPFDGLPRRAVLIHPLPSPHGITSSGSRFQFANSRPTAAKSAYYTFSYLLQSGHETEQRTDPNNDVYTRVQFIYIHIDACIFVCATGENGEYTRCHVVAANFHIFPSRGRDPRGGEREKKKRESAPRSRKKSSNQEPSPLRASKFRGLQFRSVVLPE